MAESTNGSSNGNWPGTLVHDGQDYPGTLVSQPQGMHTPGIQPETTQWPGTPVSPDTLPNPDPYASELNDIERHLAANSDITSQRQMEDLAAKQPDFAQTQKAAGEYNTAPPNFVGADKFRKVFQAVGSIGATSPEDLQESPIQAAINDTLSNQASDMTNINFLATLPAYELRAVRAAGSAQAALGAYDAAKQAVEEGQKGNTPGAAAAGTSAGLDAVMAFLLGKSTMHGSEPVRGRVEEPTRPEPAQPVPAEPKLTTQADGLSPDEAQAISSLQGRLFNGEITQQQYEAEARNLLKIKPEPPSADAAAIHQRIQEHVDNGVPEEEAIQRAVDEAFPTSTLQDAFQPQEEPRATDQEADQSEGVENPTGQQQASPEQPASVATATAPQARGAGGQAPSPLGVTGVSRAARDKAGTNRAPAQFLSVDDFKQLGEQTRADLAQQGVPEDSFIGEAVKRDSFGANEIGLAVLKDSELTEAARRARRQANDNPGRADLARVADAAESAAQKWEDEVIRPIRGQFNRTGVALQTAVDLDTGSMIDYDKAFRSQNKRAPTQAERAKLQKTTSRVQFLDKDLQRDIATREGEALKESRNKALRGDELKKSLRDLKEQLFRECIV